MSFFLNDPVDEQVPSTFEDYTVAQVSPLRLLRDGDTDPLPFTPDSLINPAMLAVSDRVRVENADGRLIIHGRAGGLPDTGYVTAGIGTAATGWTLDTQRGIIRGGIAFGYFVFTRTGGTITVPATGDIANTNVLTLNTGWASVFPAAAGMLSGAGTGRMTGGAISGSTVSLFAVAPGADIVNTNQLSLAGSWPVA